MAPAASIPAMSTPSRHPVAGPTGAPAKGARTRLTAAARRTEILEAARTVFLRSGFAGARIREISEVAGVNEALLYRHFESKETLFEAAITEPLEEVVNELLTFGLDAESRLGSPDLRRALVVELIEALLEGTRRVAPLLAALMFADGKRGQEIYRTRVWPAIEALSGAIASTGKLWEHRAFDPRLVVISALATGVALALDGRIEDEILGGREEVAHELADNILYGLEQRPGARARLG